MGKGAFRGSLHFCGQARQSARTRSKRPFPASRRRGSGDRPPHFPAGRHPAEGGPGIRPLPRFRAGRHPYRHPTASRLPDKQTLALSGRHAPGSRLTGTLRAIPVCQQPVPAAGVPLPAPTEQTCCRASLICQRPATTMAMTAGAGSTRRRVRTGTAVSGAGHAKNPLRRTPHAGRGRPKKSKNRAYIFVFVCRSNS